MLVFNLQNPLVDEGSNLILDLSKLAITRYNQSIVYSLLSAA